MSSLGYAEKLLYRADVGTVGMPELFDPTDDLQSKIEELAQLISAVKGNAEGVDMRVVRRSHETELTDANIHELMDETRQLLERIEFKDHSPPFLKVKLSLPDSEQEQHLELHHTPNEQDNMHHNMHHDSSEALTKEVLPQEHLQANNTEDGSSMNDRHTKRLVFRPLFKKAMSSMAMGTAMEDLLEWSTMKIKSN